MTVGIRERRDRAPVSNPHRRRGKGVLHLGVVAAARRSARVPDLVVRVASHSDSGVAILVLENRGKDYQVIASAFQGKLSDAAANLLLSKGQPVISPESRFLNGPKGNKIDDRSSALDSSVMLQICARANGERIDVGLRPARILNGSKSKNEVGPEKDDDLELDAALCPHIQ